MDARFLPAISVSALCLFAANVYAQTCSVPSFDSVDQQFYGGTAQIIASSDFNLDGAPDIALAGIGGVAIYLSVPSSFSPSTTVGGSAFSVDAADVDHDGHPDVVAVGAQIEVALGDGTGNFGPPLSIAASAASPIDIRLGDFDNDGNLDLAIAYDGSGVAVHLGDGLGDFSTPALFPMGVTDRIDTGDFDHDGNLDIVTTDSLTDEIHVALGLGDGSFGPPVTFTTGDAPRDVAVEDFDKDGKLDVLTVGRDLSFHGGSGTGTFAPPSSIPVPNNAGMDTGDFDNDGRLDVVISETSGHQASVYLGDGTGGFAAPVSFGVLSPLGVAVADFDRDGRDDLAVTSTIASIGLNLLENDFGFPCKNPSFEMLGRRSQFDTYPFALVSGDFDLDGNVDIVTTDPTTDSVTVRRGLGNGDLQPQSTFATGDSPISIAAADFNADGHLDVVTANANSTDLTVLDNDGLGNLSLGATLPISGPPVEVAAADVSGDGKADLIVTLTNGFAEVAFGNGDGTFQTSTTYPAGPRPDGLAVGDFDNDGFFDLAVANWVTNVIVLLPNAGDGSFLAGVSHPVGSGTPTSVRAGFFNGDANLDVVVSFGLSATASVRTMLGDGGFGLSLGPSVTVGDRPDRPFGLTVGDYDGNGTLDVALGKIGSFGVSVLSGNGVGGLVPAKFVPTGFVPRAVVFDDLDRDGVLDLLVTLPDDNDVGFLPGDGAGGFAPDFFPSASADSRGVDVGDFDHDGMLDVVVSNYDDDSFSFLQGLGGGAFAPEVSVPIGAGARPVWISAGDFDDDGHLDVVTSDSGTASVSFFAGDGTGGFLAPISTILPAPPKMAKSAYLDLDGDLDLVVLPALASQIFILTNDGNGSFTVQFPSTIPLNSVGGGIIAEDFDHDGDVDIAATHSAPDALTVFWQGPPLTWDPGPQIVIAPTLGDFDAADFNGDGTLDFVVPASGGQVDLVLSTAPGVWGFNTPVVNGLEPVAARAGDFNLDGTQDFVVASRFGHELTWWMGDGSGAALAQSTNTIGLNSPKYLAIADFNMDARPDVAVVPDTLVRSDPQGGATIVLNTNCQPRRLLLLTDVSTCDAPGTPFSSQPFLDIVDDGLNPLTCEMGPVTASFVLGTGGGAGIGGSNPVVATAGSAAFTDLSVSLPGTGYQLEFDYPGVTRRTRSRSFSQGLMPSIVGPTAVCELDPAVYDAGADYDMFQWKLDAVPVSMARTVDLTALLTPGARILDLDVVQDSCPALDSTVIDVTANLAGVSIDPPGPESVCDICTGANVTSMLTGGGMATYQWGYRTASLGAITDIPGATLWDYTLDGTDFPGTATYFLVLTVTPSCGVPIVSNEITVDVTAATAPNPLVTITTLATDTQNYLEWSIPDAGPCADVRIIRRDDGSFPTDPNDLTLPNVLVGDFPCPASKKDAIADAGLTNDTKYHYAGWVSDGANYSADSAEVTGRPFDNGTGPVMWAYATGATSVGAPGLRLLGGLRTVYIVSNDSLVHAVDGVSGVWPPNWRPTLLGGPAQSRPPATRFAVGSGGLQAVNGAVFVGSQDGDVYAIDGDEGDLVWQQNVAGMVQAAPAGIFAGFGGAQNLILVGSRDSGSPNVFRAFDVEDGSPAWTFDNGIGQGGDGSDIGIISGGAAVDYPNQRVFFASHKDGIGSMWSVDFSGAPALEWVVDLGDVEASPVYLRDAPARLVIGDNSSRVHLLDPDNLGTSIWSAAYNAADGAVKGFVFPHFGTPFYIFSTTSKVHSIRDSGAGSAPVLNWELPFTSPSTPLQIPGTNRLLVGTAAGELVQLDAIETSTPTSTSATLGDGLSTVGAPSIDLGNNIVYVGTTEGVIYAVVYPLP